MTVWRHIVWPLAVKLSNPVSGMILFGVGRIDDCLNRKPQQGYPPPFPSFLPTNAHMQAQDDKHTNRFHNEHVLPFRLSHPAQGLTQVTESPMLTAAAALMDSQTSPSRVFLRAEWAHPCVQGGNPQSRALDSSSINTRHPYRDSRWGGRSPWLRVQACWRPIRQPWRWWCCSSW